MRREKRWRYYCEFCKKSGASGGHMKRHENRCVKNPNRVCGMCDLAGEAQEPIDDLVKALGDGDADGLARLQSAADDCPACILAGIVQSDVLKNWEAKATMEYDEDMRYDYQTNNAPRPVALDWKFKPARDAFMAIVNDANRIDVAI